MPISLFNRLSVTHGDPVLDDVSEPVVLIMFGGDVFPLLDQLIELLLLFYPQAITFNRGETPILPNNPNRTIGKWWVFLILTGNLPFLTVTKAQATSAPSRSVKGSTNAHCCALWERDGVLAHSRTSLSTGTVTAVR